MDFREETVDGLATMVARKEVSARELVSAALERIEATNASINAFVAIDGEAALADADAIDQRVANGDEVGPLAGVPIGVKDMEDAQGFVTTKGSRMFAADPAAIADSLLSSGCATPAAWWSARRTRPSWPGPPRPQQGLRTDRQPLGHDPLARRLERWERRGGCRRAGADGHRIRRRWLDSHPGLAVWLDRHEAVARPCADRRAAATRIGRPVGQGTDRPHRP